MPIAKHKPAALVVAKLRRALDTRGIVAVCKETGLARVTIMTVAAGYPVREGSLAQLRASLGMSDLKVGGS